MRRAGWLAASLAGVCTLTLALGVSVPVASAALPSEFGASGSAAGQLARPAAVAVSQATGDVYVLDSGNNRVDEFTGDGVFVRAFGWEVNAHEPKDELQVCTEATGCQAGSAGSGAGQLDQPRLIGGIAVDNCTFMGMPCSTIEDPAVGDVYVLNGSGGLDQFDGAGHFLREVPAPAASSLAVGSTGLLYLGESGQVSTYEPETSSLKFTETSPLAGAGGIDDLAINAQSEIYVAEGHTSEAGGETHPLRHYDAAGAPVGELSECAD